MSDQTIVDVVINDSTATVVDNRDLSNLTIDLNATGQLLTNNLISSGNYLDSEIAIVSGITQSGSNESLTGQINQLSGNLITTGQTLQTQITSNDSDITSLTSNLVTTGQTLTTDITTVSGLIVDNDGDITALKTATGVLKTSTDSNAANLITTGQTLQTQITSNDSDINTLNTNLATTGETLTSEINSISGVVPTGGATNQVLAKIDSTNYNTQWVDQSGGGGGGSGTVTSSTATTNYLTKWTNGAGEVIGNSVAYDNGSNIGIGTVSPSSKLHVLTSGGSTTSENVVAIFQANTSSTILSGGGTAIKFKGVSSGGNQQNYDQGMISTFGYSTNNMHGMKFYYKPNSSTALTEGMRLNSSGFLSVGGQDASEKLHVFGGNIAVDNTYTIGGVNGSTGLSVSGSTLALKTGNVERAKISNDKFTIGGNVYSSLATVFNVKDSQDSSFNSGIGVFRSSGAEATYINMVGGNFNLNAPTGASTQFKVAGTNTLTILANGSVGIGTTNPSSKLHVYGGDAIINTLNIGLGAGTNNGANTSIGLSALSSNTSGVNNTAVGEYALRGNTVGINNAAFGSRSLYNNIDGDHNTAIGHYALYSNYSSDSNTAVGLGALRNTNGSNNTAIGFYSLYRNSTGTYNVANGFEAGHYIADGSTPHLTGDYNIFIGANTKALADNDQNEIVIGYNTTGAGSNSAVLGNDSVTKTVLKGAVEFKVSGSNTFAVATNGSISSSTGASLSSGGTWTDASTRELKQDIKDLDYRESLNIIKQLNPVKFAYKKDPKNKKIGFIAEDVPDLVATEDRKGLSALQIVSALTKVVQSQQKEIQQLKRMLKRLNKIK